MLNSMPSLIHKTNPGLHRFADSLEVAAYGEPYEKLTTASLLGFGSALLCVAWFVGFAFYRDYFKTGPASIGASLLYVAVPLITHKLIYR